MTASKTSVRWEARRLRLAATSEVLRFVVESRASDFWRWESQVGSRSSTVNAQRRGEVSVWVGLG